MEVLTAADVAAQLGVSPGWVTSRASRGEITHRRIGRFLRFTQEDVDELINKAKHAGHDPYARSARQLAAMNRRKTS
jgi:excisionase family DNA binding protein